MAADNPTPPSQDKPTPAPDRSRGWLGIIVAMLIASVLTFAITALLVNIFERKQEARQPFVRVVEVKEISTDPRPWGLNWPHQFDRYQRTVDITRTRYGGSEAMPESRLDKDPWLKRLYAGYAFSIDYRERRGHAYMLYDQEQTRRVLEKPQAGACLHCHASIVPTWRRVGMEEMGMEVTEATLAADFNWEAVQRGFEKMSTIPYREAHAMLLATPDGTPDDATPMPGGSSVTESTPAALATPQGAPTTQQALQSHVGVAHPVSCIDCHNPQTMQIRVTRPGFVRGIQALAASNEPVPHLPSIERWRQGNRAEPYDPNKLASRQEMRSFVCGQCHVEYYCATGMTLTFPWHNGLKVEQIEQTWSEMKFPNGEPFYDYVHTETGTRVYKAQHPEFELWSQGIHARSGVSCADCHMPYIREGAMKVSDHWVRSPLLNVNNACQTCHNVSEQELLDRVHTIQDRTRALIERAAAAMTDMLDAIRMAQAAGATEEQLADIRKWQSSAMWRLDFISSENSMGFHADQEAARILAESIDYSRRAEAAALRLVPQGFQMSAQAAPAGPSGVTEAGREPPSADKPQGQ